MSEHQCQTPMSRADELKRKRSRRWWVDVDTPDRAHTRLHKHTLRLHDSVELFFDSFRLLLLHTRIFLPLIRPPPPQIAFEYELVVLIFPSPIPYECIHRTPTPILPLPACFSSATHGRAYAILTYADTLTFSKRGDFEYMNSSNRFTSSLDP